MKPIPEIHSVYEMHALTDVPVIFHRDMVRGTKSRQANWHENIEILRFTAGEGAVVCEENRTPVRAGDISVIDSGLLHRIESEGEVRYDCLIVDEAFCHGNGLFPGTATVPRLIQNDTLRSQYDNVAAIFESDAPYRLPELRASVLLLMVTLMRDFSRPATERDRSSDADVRTAIGYIRAHFAKPLSLDLLSAEVGCSKYHLIRKFKEATGQTVVGYINAVRIEQAERMLKKGGSSVAEIAEGCGFTNHSYFSKVFYRLRGSLPSDVPRQG